MRIATPAARVTSAPMEAETDVKFSTVTVEPVLACMAATNLAFGGVVHLVGTNGIRIGAQGLDDRIGDRLRRSGELSVNALDVTHGRTRAQQIGLQAGIHL